MPPLGLLSIAAYLEKFGYEVKVIDAIAECLSDSAFEALVRQYRPDICGVTIMLENYLGACTACKVAKNHGAITVIGGPGLESYPKDMIDKDYIDYGVVGEGEETFLGLIKAIEARDLERIKQIPGVSYKTSDGIIPGKPQVMSNLDLLPHPAYHLVNIGNYSSLINDYPIITYMMGRGCPFQCAFCKKQETDKFIRFRSPKLVVDDMESLVSRYKIKEFMFYDDTFTLFREQVIGVCEEIIKRGVKVKFEAPTRIDNLVKKEGIELLKLLKRAGCYRLRLGVESGDEGILAKMNKAINLKNVELAFQRCKKMGIQTFAYFMVGYLGESRDSFERTINFAVKINPDFVMFTIATPYPKTKLYEESFKAGLVPAEYWKSFIREETKERLPFLVAGADELAKQAYRRFYLRVPYFLKAMLRLKSRRHIKNALAGAAGLFFYKN